MKLKFLILTAVAAGMLSSVGQAQTEAGPPPPPADARDIAVPTDQRIGTNPAIEYLRERHGISPDLSGLWEFSGFLTPI